VFEGWLHGFQSLSSPHELLFLGLGVTVGLFVGVLPGLGGVATLALITPLTYGMSTVSSFALAGGVMGAVPMGGAITAILLNTPGHGANVVTCLDGYPLATQGKAGLAIGAAASSNAIGGLIGAITVLAVLPLANVLVFAVGPPEFFLLALLGLLLVATISRGRLLRSVISAGFGLMLATVGYSSVTGGARFTFGSDYLWNGIPITPPLIGMFAVAEMLNLMIKGGSVLNTQTSVKVTNVTSGLVESFRHWGTLLQGSLIGTFLGCIPGCGAAVSSFLSYSITARFSKDPESFGKGNIKGIIATEAAVNAKDGSTLIPTLALGVPGSAEMAVFMGILILHGMQPGPFMLIGHQTEIYSLIWAITASCFVASAIGLLLARPLSKVTAIDSQLLAPIVIVIAFAGSYAVDREVDNIIITAVFALFGYMSIRFDFPRIAMVMAMVLGGIALRSYEQSMMISNGSWSIFVTRPVCMVLVFCIIVGLLAPILLRRSGLRLARGDAARPLSRPEEVGDAKVKLSDG
jgi:putative tricarboxylic transport membrane protein